MNFEGIEMAVQRIQECIVGVDKSLAAGLLTRRTRDKFVDFLNNMRTQLSTGRAMSPGQNKYVSDIEQQCSSEKIKEASDWVLNYNDDLREVALICAEYYEHSPDGQSYFREQRRKVIDNPKGHVLSKKDFTKMCMNKYVDKVIRERQSEPRFIEGQMVQLRASNRIDMFPTKTREERTRYYKIYRKGARGEKVMGMILEINARPIYRSTMGAKVYKVLLVGDSRPIFACEKDLKKAR
jgi:hypothetical protein